MKLSKALQSMENRAKQHDAYWITRAKLDFSVMLESCRRFADLSYKALAEKLGTSPAYVTKVFRGDANLTIESMVKLARATGGELKIEITHQQAAKTANAWGDWIIDQHQETTGWTTPGITMTRAANSDQFKEPAFG